jgi:hypothetical protein
MSSLNRDGYSAEPRPWMSTEIAAVTTKRTHAGLLVRMRSQSHAIRIVSGSASSARRR